MDDGVDPASGQSTWTPDRAEQLFWGARYIDDAVGRRRSTAIADADDPAPTVTWGALQHYLTDAQFSVVALMDSTAAAGFDIIERVKYDPYGRAVHCQRGDYNGDGVTNVQDIFDQQANYFTPKLAGDVNRDGTVSVQDIFDFLTLYYNPGKDAAGDQVSSPDVAGGGNDNCVGYCGYIHNPETGDYTVRFRTYMPSLGRWGERDPAGYVDGANLLEYGSSRSTSVLDPNGLDTTPDGDQRPGGARACRCDVPRSVTPEGLKYEDLRFYEPGESAYDRWLHKHFHGATCYSSRAELLAKLREARLALQRRTNKGRFGKVVIDGHGGRGSVTALFSCGQLKEIKRRKESGEELSSGYKEINELLAELKECTDDLVLNSCNTGRGEEGDELKKLIKELYDVNVTASYGTCIGTPLGSIDVKANLSKKPKPTQSPNSTVSTEKPSGEKSNGQGKQECECKPDSGEPLRE